MYDVMRAQLSAIKKAALAMLKALGGSIRRDFTDNETERLVARMGRCMVLAVNEHDFVNYDKALAILGLKTNRQKLNELCKRHGIKNVRFNNAYIGFPRREIEALARKLRKEKDKG